MATDKGRSTVILNCKNYLEKCSSCFSSCPFHDLNSYIANILKLFNCFKASRLSLEVILRKFELLKCRTLHPRRIWERFVENVYSILKRTPSIKFTTEEKGNGELALLDILLKRNNEKIFALVYRKPTHTDQHLHYSSHHQTSCK